MFVLRLILVVWSLKIARLQEYDLTKKRVFKIRDLLDKRVVVFGETVEKACDPLLGIQV